jgi:HEAT repeat protein
MYKAFVSSTFVDLKGHRAHVINSLRRAGFFVDPMEDWSADSDEPKVFSTDRIRDCQVCVLLVGFRRGFVPDGEEKSITQLEYEYARDHGIDVLAFLLADDAAWRRDYDETHSDHGIVAWRIELQKRHGVGFFGEQPETVEIASAIARWLIKRHERELEEAANRVAPVGVLTGEPWDPEAVGSGPPPTVEVREYFESLAELPDRPPLPAYLGTRTPTSLYVPAEVLKQEGGERTPQSPSASPAAIPITVPSDARDLGEAAIYGEGHEDRERRVPWDVERRLLERGPGRVALLAPPGAGKSFLAQMTASDMARRGLSLLASGSEGLDKVQLPVFLTLPSLAEAFADVAGEGGIRRAAAPEPALRRSLALALVQQGCPARAAGYLAHHAREPRAWLFLDGLDDVSQTAPLSRMLQIMDPWPSRLVLTSRPYGYDATLLPSPATRYRLAPFSPGQVQALIRRWFGEGDERRRMEALLQRSPSVRHMAQSPFLLTLLCWMFERHSVPQEATRTQLYDRVVRDTLGLAPEGVGSVNELRGSEWMPLLSEVALEIFREQSGRGAIRGQRLLELLAGSDLRPALEGLTDAETARLSPLQQASGLLRELRRKRVLVPTDAAGSRFAFPHRSLWEFLAAWPIGDRLGLEASPLWEFVDRKGWDPGWEECLVFVAGLLAMRTGVGGERPVRRLLELFAADGVDDPRGHRLALAVRCLAELPPDARDEERAAIEGLSSAALRLWQEHEEMQTLVLIPHLSRALPSLGRAGARVDGVGILEWLVGRLESEDGPGRRTAVDLAKVLGIDADPDLLPRLLALLDHDDGAVRQVAAQALGWMGHGSSAGVVERVTELLLEDESEAARWTAARALEAMGDSANPALERLADLLQGHDGAVRRKAALGLRAIGPAAATATVLERLAELLSDPDPVLRRAGARTIGAMGPAGAVPWILDRLADVLPDPEADVRRGAAWAIGAIGPPAAAPRVLEEIAGLLADTDPAVRGWAAWAVARTAAPSAALLDGLESQLVDPDPGVRREAADAIRQVGAPTAAVAERLLELASADGDWQVRRAAARALGSPLVRGRLPDLVDRLVEGLSAPSDDLRRGALWSIEAMGSSAGVPAVLDCVTRLLEEGEGAVWEDAAGAIAGLGNAAATPRIISRLVALLEEGDPDATRAAARAIGSLGSEEARRGLLGRIEMDLAQEDPAHRRLALEWLLAADSLEATPGILDVLADLTKDRDASMRRLAAEALARAERAGVRQIRDAETGAAWAQVKDLSRAS